MSIKIGKYKVSRREALMSIKDGGTVEGGITFSGDGGLFKPNSSPATNSTAHTLSNADSGKTVFLDASGGATTITLPAISTVSAGWHIKVVLTATGAAGVIQTGNTLEDKLLGQVTFLDSDGSVHTVQNDAHANTITFLNTCIAGSYVDIISNGSMFYVNGLGTHATAAGKLTLTDE
jgi:hypothetical protein